MKVAAVVLASATLLIVSSVGGVPPVTKPIAKPAPASAAAHVPASAPAPKAETSCIHCHGGELFDDADVHHTEAVCPRPRSADDGSHLSI